MFGDDGNESAAEETHRGADSEGGAVGCDAASVKEAARQPRRRSAEIGTAALGAEHLGMVAVIIVIRDAVDIILAAIGVYIDAIARLQVQRGSHSRSDKDASVSTEGDVRASYRLEEMFHDAKLGYVAISGVLTLVRLYQCQ